MLMGENKVKSYFVGFAQNNGQIVGDGNDIKVISLNRKEEHYQPRLIRLKFNIR